MKHDDEDLHDPEFDGGALNEDHIDDHCSAPVLRDCVDDCLEGLIEELVKSGYDDEVAMEAVYQSMATLMESNTIADTPDIDQPEPAKYAWIANASAQIRAELARMGLEFDPA